MNREWAIGRLEEWLRLAAAYEPLSLRNSEERSSAARELLAVTPQAEQIVRTRYTISAGLVSQVAGDWDHLLVDHGIHAVHQAVGLLRTEEETAANLGPLGPRMRADQMHPVVWDAAKGLWTDGYHTDAVKRAASFLNAHLAARLDRSDVSDAALMREAFSANPPAPGKARLRWPGDPASLTVKSMDDGLRNYAPGVFLAVRNVTTHGTAELDEQIALEQLAALSLLARWIDTCLLEAPKEGA